jgi:1-acyl-sn-glycerol-3-phosphate acyltransferase
VPQGRIVSMARPDPSPERTPDPSPAGLPEATTRDYDTLLAEARRLYPGVRIGRPGRSRTYWATIAAMRLLRVRWAVDIDGADKVAPGPAILIGNHVHFVDPVCVVMATWWRCSAFTKVEWFEHRGSLFFRLMGQIPLRRGDVASTEWAMQMSRYALGSSGGVGRIALYPEGTRSPDPNVLHKLHKRIMIPLLQANPDVPVHVVTTQYENHSFPRRIRAHVRVSEPLPLDPRTMNADELATIVRDALLALGGQTYMDTYAQDVKAEKHAGRRGRPEGHTS